MIFDEEETIKSNVTWYFADDNAELLGTQTLFGSGTYAEKGNDLYGVGEDWSSARPFSNGDPPYYSPGTGGVCGKAEWFANGVPKGTPPIEYSAAGVPVCCPQPPCQPETGHPSLGTLFNQTTSQVWPRVVGSEWKDPVNAGVFVHQAPNGVICKAFFTTPVVEGVQLTLEKLTTPTFTAIGKLVSASFPPSQGVWTFPGAPAPWNGYTFSFTVGP